jgi:outer membrane protein assembly factor BamB
MGASVIRRDLTITAAAVLLLIAPSSVSAAFHFPLFHHASHDWTQFRMGPDNNAVVGGKLETSWRVETHGEISASPTLVDGTLYIGNNAGRLYAIDASNGHTLWTHRVSNPLMSAPLVYGDLVIAGEGDAQSMGTSPAEPIAVGQGPSALIALDRRTGARRWIRVLRGSGMPTPAIIDGTLVHHNGSGWVGGFDPQTGAQRFARQLESVASMSAILPVGGGEFVTAGVGDNAVWRITAGNGTIRWTSDFPAGVSGLGDCPPVADANRIMCDYVVPVPPAKMTAVGASVTEHAYALDAGTGAPQWDVALETGTLAPRNEAAIPLVAQGLLFIGSSFAPAMHALDESTGQTSWTLKTHGTVKGGAVFVDGAIYFGDFGGYLWAVDARTGTVVGDKSMQTKFNVGSPVVDGKTLIVGSDDGAVIAIPLQTIRQSHDP